MDTHKALIDGLMSAARHLSAWQLARLCNRVQGGADWRGVTSKREIIRGTLARGMRDPFLATASGLSVELDAAGLELLIRCEANSWGAYNLTGEHREQAAQRARALDAAAESLLDEARRIESGWAAEGKHGHCYGKRNPADRLALEARRLWGLVTQTLDALNEPVAR